MGKTEERLIKVPLFHPKDNVVLEIPDDLSPVIEENVHYVFARRKFLWRMNDITENKDFDGEKVTRDNFTWKHVAVMIPELVQWIVQKYGPLPDGPVKEEDYNKFKELYEKAME